MNQIESLQKQLLDDALRYGFSEAETYVIRGRSLDIHVFEKKISRYESSQEQGISFRGVIEGRMGYAYSEKIDPSVIPWMLEEAASNASVLADSKKEDLFDGHDTDAERDQAKANRFSQSLAELEPQVLIDSAMAMEAAALETDSRIRKVEYAAVAYMESERYIKNSLGLSVHDRSNLAYAFALARAASGDSVKKGVEIWQGHDLDPEICRSIGRKAAERAIAVLGARPVPSARLPVVLENRAAIDLLTAFLPAFFADRVQQGLSLLGEKLGQPVASDCVSLVDDPFHNESFYQPPFDSEGVPTRITRLIDSGTLNSFLHNRQTAAKDGTSSTGNGFRPSWKMGVQVAATNCLVLPGPLSRDALCSEMNNGLLIQELTGLHAGTNLISGDFSLSAEGFLIEDGVIVHPVEQITVAGNFFDLLRQVRQVGSDLLFDLPGASGQIACPSLLIAELAISGESS